MKCITRHISKKGISHLRNEDSFIVRDHYLVLADGMGGQSNGDIASKIAVSAVSNLFESHLKDAISQEEIVDLSLLAIKDADRRILEYVACHPESEGMGTTIVLFVWKGGLGYVFWCGDSRCYVHSGNLFMAVSKDHSYVQELIDRDELTIEESFTHPDNNLLTRYVGGGDWGCVPEYRIITLNADSTVVLCSDGLSGYCKDSKINELISSAKMKDVPKLLYRAALKNGSQDDITILTSTFRKDRRTFWEKFRFGKI